MSAGNFRGNAVLGEDGADAGVSLRHHETMRRLLRTLLPLTAIAALAIVAAPAAAATRRSPLRAASPRASCWSSSRGSGAAGRSALAPGVGVRQAARSLRSDPRVVYAVPNYIATASAAKAAPFDPDDSGALEGGPEASSAAGGWAYKQWNFLSPEADGDGAAGLAGRDRRRRRLAQPDRSRPARRRRRRRRGPRQRHRLPLAGHRAFAAAPISGPASSCPATTSSTATACRSTKAATAPTSPGRSARGPTTGSASPGSPTGRS